MQPVAFNLTLVTAARKLFISLFDFSVWHLFPVANAEWTPFKTCAPKAHLSSLSQGWNYPSTWNHLTTFLQARPVATVSPKLSPSLDSLTKPPVTTLCLWTRWFQRRGGLVSHASGVRQTWAKAPAPPLAGVGHWSARWDVFFPQLSNGNCGP